MSVFDEIVYRVEHNNLTPFTAYNLISREEHVDKSRVQELRQMALDALTEEGNLNYIPEVLKYYSGLLVGEQTNALKAHLERTPLKCQDYRFRQGTFNAIVALGLTPNMDGLTPKYAASFR